MRINRPSRLLIALMMGTSFVVGGLFVSLVHLPLSAVAEEKQAQPQRDKVVAVVCKKEITVGMLEDKIAEVPMYARKNFLKVDGKEKILENMIKGELLYCAAKNAGYDKDPEVQAKVKETIKSIYQSEYFKRELQDAVVKSEQKARDYYEQHKEQYSMPESRKVRHIEFEDRAKALEVKEQLEAGGNWVELCREHSQDRSTFDTGGFLGHLREDGVVTGLGQEPNITSAVFAARLFEVVGPVKSKRGWHLLRVEEVRPKSYQPFDSVKAEIADKFLVTDEQIQAEYEATIEDHQTNERVKVAHIQFEDRATADKILAILKKGGKEADWAQLCRVHSKDDSTATKEGELGWVYRDGVIRNIGKDAELEAELFKLRPNDLSAVLATDKGFHIFKCLAYEPVRQKTLGEMRPVLRNKLLRRAREDLLENEFDKLKAKYGCEMNKQYIVDTTWQLTDMPGLSPGEGQEGGVQMPFLPGGN
jgi:peptidyl-prolyl cis-trans isomerase C